MNSIILTNGNAQLAQMTTNYGLCCIRPFARVNHHESLRPSGIPPDSTAYTKTILRLERNKIAVSHPTTLRIAPQLKDEDRETAGKKRKTGT